ncbi:DUF370 domain-containing protein [Selenomonadales bacterium OttesenSCG-928-I06]|nr:DUF370 domain-containing protein [Selenomonadales bacterium OttesenSCG-928-I06]
MFLHIGIDKIIPFSSVIAILDVKISKLSINDQYFKKAYKNKNLKIIDVSENDPKSFIVTDKEIYFSAISSQTLKKRTLNL